MPETPPLHSVSVAAAIVADDGRVLAIQRRDNGAWEPPGGVLELGETIEAGLRREVHEETGLHVEPERLTGVYKNMPRGIIALVFRCHVVAGDLRTTDETKDARWLAPEEIPTLMTPAYTIRLQDALVAGRPQTRAHNGVDVIDAEPEVRRSATN